MQKSGHLKFALTETDAKGKRRKAYRQADIRTPYERLKALPEAARYVRPETSIAELDREAHEALFAELRDAAALQAHYWIGMHSGDGLYRVGRLLLGWLLNGLLTSDYSEA